MCCLLGEKKGEADVVEPRHPCVDRPLGRLALADYCTLLTSARERLRFKYPGEPWSLSRFRLDQLRRQYEARNHARTDIRTLIPSNGKPHEGNGHAGKEAIQGAGTAPLGAAGWDAGLITDSDDPDL